MLELGLGRVKNLKTSLNRTNSPAHNKQKACILNGFG